MVAPIFNETILVVVEPHDNLRSARRRSAGSIVARASLTGFNHADFTILKDTFDSWGKRDYEEFDDILAEKKTNRSVVIIQKTLRGWMTRRRMHISQLENKLASIEAEKKQEILRIKQEKEQRMRQMRKQVELELQNRALEEESTLLRAQEIIQHLKHENASIRKTNQRIQKELKELVVGNERLQNTYNRAVLSLEEISTIIQSTSKNVSALKQEEANLIHQIKDTIEAIHVFDEVIGMEHSVVHDYNKCLGNIFEELKDRKEACVPELRTQLIECIELGQERMAH